MRNILLGLILSLGLISQGYCADQWDKNQLAGTTNASDIDYYNLINNEALDRFLSYGRHDCKLTYASASTITVGTGSIVCSNSGGTVRRLRANTSATTATWTNIDTGSEAASTTYYVYALADTDATTFTVSISTNSTAPTGATYYKKLGSFYNDSSSNITQITDDSQSANIAYLKGQGNYYKVDSGTASLSNGVETAISFSITFAAAPIVIVSAGNDIFNSTWAVLGKSATTTGFTGRALSITSGTLNWIAIGQVYAQ